MSNDVYKAIADPTRRKILQLLRGGELSAGEIAEHFDVSKPALSRQFAILAQADLIYSRKDKNQVFYGLNATVLQEVLMGFVGLFDKGEKQ